MKLWLIWHGDETVDQAIDSRYVSEEEVKKYVYEKNDNGRFRIWYYSYIYLGTELDYD